jgi:hypothetical protein
MTSQQILNALASIILGTLLIISEAITYKLCYGLTLDASNLAVILLCANQIMVIYIIMNKLNFNEAKDDNEQSRF